MNCHRFFNSALFFSILLGITSFLIPSELHAQWKANEVIRNLQFQQPFLSNGQSFSNMLTSNEVLAIHQDRDGFIWIATRYGFNRYDGYRIRNYKFPDSLVSTNSIQCLTDDYNHNLWLGTKEGIIILNKVTGELQHSQLPNAKDQNISTLITARDKTTWIGSEKGLFRYFPNTKRFLSYDLTSTHGILPVTAIKSLLEDSQGDIWIGTWDKGLYRYSSKKNRFIAYPQFNEYNSAHVLLEDHQGDIWVGTWRAGVYRLKNPREMQTVNWECFRHSENDPNSISDNIIYSLAEDPYTNTIWIGTRSGLSILNKSEDRSIINYRTNHPSYRLPYDEISSLLRSQQNIMWAGTIGGGVYMINTQPPLFNLIQLRFSRNDISSQAIRHLFVDSHDWVWLGTSAYGIARCKSDGSQAQYWRDIPEFSEIKTLGGVLSIIERRTTGELWFGTADGELFIYHEGQKIRQQNLGNALPPFSKISSLMEDSEGNCWIGTINGLCILYNNGRTYVPDYPISPQKKLSECHITTQLEDRQGNIWLGTHNNGIIRIQGNIYQPSDLKYTVYNSQNGRFPKAPIASIFQDHSGKIWIGTNGKGLFSYHPSKDSFETVSDKFHIAADVVSNIEEDENRNLWLGTNKGLVKLSFIPGEEPAGRIYTDADGLKNSYPNNGTSFKTHGKLYFGGTNGFCSFDPEEIKDAPMKSALVITHINIFNTPLEELDPVFQKRITTETPEFTKKLTIPYSCNNISIEFAALVYDETQLIHYAYMLKGFDKDWQYTDGTQRLAHYNNLPTGKYTFVLKAANANGIWSGNTREIEITVLPPFWATWWAYLIYAILFATIAYIVYRTLKNRIRLQNQLRISAIEQAKSEEMNHAKLQFFTNLTHELMTPLSILSASIDELKAQNPESKSTYSIMSRNVNRLIRLLQQILEFRKAESGNLKLRVSKGDLISFLHNEIEAFRPLIKKRNLTLSMYPAPEKLEGYFDPDKLDKIVYNLLSNAAKYNKEGGNIQVGLQYTATDQILEITVSDTGKGISPEGQKDLFTRFYEGDYRRFNTIGTGIGLSLTKDLVLLHKGSIRVESTPDQGTTFFVTLPIGRKAFDSSQIDEEIEITQDTTLPPKEEANTQEPIELQEAEPTDEKTYALLLVEDNEDLLRLMTQLLGKEYKIYTAQHGKEAINIVEKEDINLIVSDLMMPEMDGLSLCKTLKNNINYSHIPFIILTAKNREEDRAEAYDCGADGYIIKPFNLTVLHAKIKNLLNKKEHNANDFQRQFIFEIKDFNYNAVDEDFLQRAIDCINRNLEDPDFDQQQLADALQSSKTNLYRKLKSLTGLPPSAFIYNIRMKAACKLMSEQKNLRIYEVAYAVGFKDAKYFSTCFRKEFGMQPKEFMSRFTDHPLSSDEE